MTTPPIDSRSARSRRSLLAVTLALAALLAVYFATQVLSGDRYRTISDANRATNPVPR